MEIINMTLKESLKDDDTFFAFLKQNGKEFRKTRKKTETEHHPSGEMLYDYVLNLLDEKDERLIVQHISVCGICTDKVSDFMRIENELDEDLSVWEDTHEKVREASFVPALREAAEQVTEFISSLFWIPEYAGQRITSADISEQTKTFQTDEGEIRISCVWKGQSDDSPPYIRLQWDADVKPGMEFEICFVNPDTSKVFHKLRPGRLLKGSITLKKEKLGFNPAVDRWGISIEH